METAIDISKIKIKNFSTGLSFGTTTAIYVTVELEGFSKTVTLEGESLKRVWELIKKETYESLR